VLPRVRVAASAVTEVGDHAGGDEVGSGQVGLAVTVEVAEADDNVAGRPIAEEIADVREAAGAGPGPAGEAAVGLPEGDQVADPVRVEVGSSR
jgi:hypothetical protein